MIILYFIIFLPVAIFSIAVILWLAFVRPRISHAPLRDALILAAHQDDCVIMAGEYGIDALKSGRSVTVMYMTAGDTQAGTDYSNTRKAETLHAWSMTNLPPDHVRFIDAPQSDLYGTPAQDDICKKLIQNEIREAIFSLPPESAVFIPAAGELHVDHRTLRALALSAVEASQRTDIRVYECPEYTSYCSLTGNPFLVLRNGLRLIPLVRRIAEHMAFATAYPHFATFAPGALRLPPNEARLKLKGDMLRAYVSQGSDNLHKYFCKPDVFRYCDPSKAAAEIDSSMWIRVNGFVYTWEAFFSICSIFLSMAAAGGLLVLKIFPS